MAAAARALAPALAAARADIEAFIAFLASAE
jgi:hypothetical protein